MFTGRRRAYIERVEADREWRERVIRRIIHQGGGQLQQDYQVSKLAKFCQFFFICKFGKFIKIDKILTLFKGFSLSLVPLLMLGLEILSYLQFS